MLVRTRSRQVPLSWALLVVVPRVSPAAFSYSMVRLQVVLGLFRFLSAVGQVLLVSIGYIICIGKYFKTLQKGKRIRF